jgi:hypothetical protein
VPLATSQPLYDSGIFWAGAAVAVGFLAILVTITLWWLGGPRRLLAYHIPVAAPLLSAHWPLPPDDAPVQVTIAGQPIDNPHVVVLQLRNKSRRDIRSSDFDQDKPLVFDLGTNVVAIDTPASLAEALKFTTTGISFGPTLIQAGQILEVTLIAVGPPDLTCHSPLVNVRVRQQNPAELTPAVPGFLVGVFVCLLLVAISYGSKSGQDVAFATASLVCVLAFLAYGFWRARRRPRPAAGELEASRPGPKCGRDQRSSS